ncbi:MAG: hypothetical protein KAV18_06765 [Candidatus Omnitrophica bacterium]|nr:hypothetical protein [Candidatus Omnitrophota bacterium]MCK4423755.1 hypothetical protein [Candidatus Omnitrophota bacterium]
MSNNEETIKALKKCINIEESVIDIYARHIGSSLFLSGFNEKDQADIDNMLKTLKDESEYHKSLYDELLERIEHGYIY